MNKPYILQREHPESEQEKKHVETEKLHSQIEEVKKRAQVIKNEEERRQREEENFERKVESERAKRAALEETRANEKIQLGTEVLKRLAELKADQIFVEAVRLLTAYDWDGEVDLYRRNSTDPAEALSNNRCDVLHEFGLYGDGRLFFKNWEPPRSWAESMARGGSVERAQRRAFLNKPEDFKTTSYRSLREFNALLQSDRPLKALATKTRQLSKDLKTGKASIHNSF